MKVFSRLNILKKEYLINSSKFKKLNFKEIDWSKVRGASQLNWEKKVNFKDLKIGDIAIVAGAPGDYPFEVLSIDNDHNLKCVSMEKLPRKKTFKLKYNDWANTSFLILDKNDAVNKLYYK